MNCDREGQMAKWVGMRWKAMCLSTVLGATVAVIAACSSATAPERVLIPISQLVVPDSISIHDVLSVDVTVDYGGCAGSPLGGIAGVSFSRAPDRVTVAVWGERSAKTDVPCPDYGMTSTVHIDIPGPWRAGSVTVSAEQPGSAPAIVHQVQVR